jgi:hypothetical protein
MAAPRSYGAGRYGIAPYGGPYRLGAVVLTLAQPAETVLLVGFSAQLDLTGAPGLAAADPLSYALASVSGHGYPAGSFSPSAAEVVSATLVRLTIPLISVAEVYRLTIGGLLRRRGAGLLTGTSGTWVSTVVSPRVNRVLAVAARTLDITFSRELQDTPALVDPSHYVISGGLAAESVLRVSGTAVRVVLTRAMTGGRKYALVVLANP